MTAWEHTGTEQDPEHRFHRAIPEPASLGWSDSPENAPLSLPCEACGEDHAPNERCDSVPIAPGYTRADLKAKVIELKRERALLEAQHIDMSQRIDRLKHLLADALERNQQLQRVVYDLQERVAFERERGDKAEGALRDYQIEAAAAARPDMRRSA